MTKNKFIYIAFMLSYVTAMAASVAGLSIVAVWVGAPALLLSGWALIGHFVTLDDDMPGEWSNSEGSKRVWYLSLGELSLKAAIFLALVIVVYLSVFE